MILTETDKLRLLILNNSLDFEYLVSTSLCDLLDIDIKTSNSFGNKSTSLSLYAKVGILLDLKTIDKNESKVLICYMEIRNKFMHDMQCNSFEKCFAIIESTGKYLLKKYNPLDSLTLEEKYQFCYNKLTEDAAEIVVNKILGSAIDSKVKRDQTKIKIMEEINYKKRVDEVLIGLNKNQLFLDYKIPENRIFEFQKELTEKIYDI